MSTCNATYIFDSFMNDFNIIANASQKCVGFQEVYDSVREVVKKLPVVTASFGNIEGTIIKINEFVSFVSDWWMVITIIFAIGYAISTVNSQIWKKIRREHIQQGVTRCIRDIST